MMKEVHWKSLITGATGHSKPLNDELAEEVVKISNKEYPEIYHYTVKVMK